MAVLLPIWSTKRVTAGQVRQRIGTVTKQAVAQGYRDDNPAGAAISAALPKTVVRQQHMRTLPHAEIAAALGRGAQRPVGADRPRRGGVDDPGRAHRVPFSPRALEVLDSAAEFFDGAGLVFSSPTGRVLNHAALTNLLHGLGINAVAHGFRSSFRDRAAECTDAPSEVCELALATSTATGSRPRIGAATCSTGSGSR